MKPWYEMVLIIGTGAQFVTVSKHDTFTEAHKAMRDALNTYDDGQVFIDQWIKTKAFQKGFPVQNWDLTDANKQILKGEPSIWKD